MDEKEMRQTSDMKKERSRQIRDKRRSGRRISLLSISCCCLIHDAVGIVMSGMSSFHREASQTKRDITIIILSLLHSQRLVHPGER
jgi:hypothetical protein